MRAIEWHAAFEVGHPSIDGGHHAIIAALNETIRALNGSSSDRLSAAVTEAIEAARQHFSQEEALLAEAGFVDVDRHVAYHRRLLAEAEKILDMCRKERFPSRLEARIPELIHFLMAEIRDNDKELRPYLTGSRDGAAASDGGGK